MSEEQTPGTAVSSSATSELSVVLVVYGSLAVALVIIYSLLRTRFPSLFTPRSVFENLQCELSSRKLTLLSWIPGVWKMRDHEIFEQCGMDAICFIRMLRFGLKVSIVACVNAVWLLPTYRTGPDHPSTLNVTDALDKLSIANVPAGDDRLFGTVIASYFLFGATMLLLKREFEWYICERHLFMVRRTPESYSILISGIPPALRSKTAMGDYLRSIFHDTVLQIEFALHVSDLEKLVAKRESLLYKLEHARAVLEHRGKRPIHLNFYGQRVDSITVFEQHDMALTKQINMRIAAVMKELEEHEETVHARLVDPWRLAQEGSDDLENDPFAPEPPSLIREAAFVSFTSIQSAENAKQILHHRTPFRLSVIDAPSPSSVWWSNVGLSHARVQVTTVLAGGLTVLLCILWTVPVSTIATFTKVESLKKRLPFLQSLSQDFREVDDLLALVSPVALITLVSLLPLLIYEFAKLEGHVGTDALQASLFSKFATFMIVQVFFVSSVAGTLFEQLDVLLTEPAEIARILGTALPGQAVTFMTFTFVKSTLNLLIELLRVAPALLALLRSIFAHNLTEKEREALWLGLPPLRKPGSLDLSFPLAHTILMYVVLFVYAVLAPISSFVMAFGFLAWEIAYKHQFAFVYDPSKDTGGKIWTVFAGYMVVCMLIGQVTILGVISLKEGVRPAPFMFPLIVGTVLFWRYLRQQHFRAAKTVPMRQCIGADRAGARERIDYGFVINQYRQKELFPIDPAGEQDPAGGTTTGANGHGRTAACEPEEDLHSCASNETPPLPAQDTGAAPTAAQDIGPPARPLPDEITVAPSPSAQTEEVEVGPARPDSSRSRLLTGGREAEEGGGESGRSSNSDSDALWVSTHSGRGDGGEERPSPPPTVLAVQAETTAVAAAVEGHAPTSTGEGWRNAEEGGALFAAIGHAASGQSGDGGDDRGHAGGAAEGTEEGQGGREGESRVAAYLV